MKIETAMNKFGYGLRADENGAQSPNMNTKDWLERQIVSYIAKPAAIGSQPSSVAAGIAVTQSLMARRQARKANAAEATPLAPYENLRRFYIGAVNARVQTSLNSATPFMERLVHFWSNHFAVSVDKIMVRALAGSYEFEAIRPNVTLKFRDMLLAAITHPAMLDFLDQNRSIGPSSRFVANRANRDGANSERAVGLNENLAREIMELHTLGVHGGYSQADVTEFAKALTGFTIMSERRSQLAGARVEVGKFYFEPNIHEPGTRTIMGRSYRQDDGTQALAIIDFLIAHPSTARNIATKLARHFTTDNPPQRLIDALAADFMRTGGDLPSLYQVLISSPDIMNTNNSKFKSPWDWLISSMRGLGFDSADNIDSSLIMQNLGQAVWQPKSPKGYDDIDAAWVAPDALTRRIELAWQLSLRAKTSLSPSQLADKLIGTELDSHTKTAISRAESPSSGFALLIVSPQFMRR